MIVTDHIKILDRKIKQNEEQYDLDRKAARISALSSNNMDKYEYLTGEDLGLQPSTVEQAKFEYSPLGKVFNKELKDKGKKEGFLKRLKNIEKNQNSNNNGKNEKKNHISDSSSARSESSSARSESSTTQMSFFLVFQIFLIQI